ncbi:MAG TPA: type II toxin-antitoxin system VapC family toxin [Pyrinomonadaceae bacterium]
MILDTNAVSDFADANQGLLNSLQQSAADIHLPVIVLGEYRYGVKSSRLRAARESWLDELEASAIVLTVTPETSRVYADIRHELRVAGQPIPENDLWIAALARQHGLPILTNDAHFDQVAGLQRISW